MILSLNRTVKTRSHPTPKPPVPWMSRVVRHHSPQIPTRIQNTHLIKSFSSSSNPRRFSITRLSMPSTKKTLPLNQIMLSPASHISSPKETCSSQIFSHFLQKRFQGSTNTSKISPISSFLDQSSSNTKGPIFDVRSPVEFEQGHIPGSFNLPLFTDQQREAVGITYKRAGREKAIKQGLEFVGPNLLPMVERVESVLKKNKYPDQKTIRLYCARGGMRSSSVGWLLNLLNFKVEILDGGYKKFRRYVLNTFTDSFLNEQHPLKFIILGGETGSGKTDILKALREHYSHQFIDLEDLATHKGSAFGKYLAESPKCQEQFENLLAIEWRNQKPQFPVFLEAESQRIGRCTIPKTIFQQMQESVQVYLKIPREERNARLVAEYSQLPLSELHAMTDRIEKNLGKAKKDTVHQLLDEERFYEASDLLLVDYYDPLYSKALKNRKGPTHHVASHSGDTMLNAEMVHQAVLSNSQFFVENLLPKERPPISPPGTCPDEQPSQTANQTLTE